MVRGFAILLTVTGLAMGQAMVQHAAAAAGGAAAAAGSKKVADGLEGILGSAAGATANAAAPKQPIPAPPTAKRAKKSPFDPQVNRAGGGDLAPVAGTAHASIPSPADVETMRLSGEAAPNNPWMSRGRTRSTAPPSSLTPFLTDDAPAPVASRGARRGNAQIAETMIAPPSPSAVTLPAEMMTATAVMPPPPPPVLATAEKFAAIQPGASYREILATLGTPAAKIEMVDDDGKMVESLRIEARGNKLGTILLVNGIVTLVEPVVR